MRIEIASKNAIKYSCLNYHYAKSVPVNTLGYSVFNDNEEFCGVILYGIGANNNIASQYNLLQGEVIELVRVALNGKQEQTSKALAMTLKRVKKDVPLCKLIVSYADCDQSHIGTIYQATNWIYTGISMKDKHDSSWIINGERKHGRVISDIVKKKGGLNGISRDDFIRKYLDKNAIKYVTKGKIKYLYPLDKKTREFVSKLAKPYPKKQGVNKDGTI